MFGSFPQFGVIVAGSYEGIGLSGCRARGIVIGGILVVPYPLLFLLDLYGSWLGLYRCTLRLAEV